MGRPTRTPGRQRPGASRGPARDAGRDERIIEAVLELVTEHGYAELTMAAVAARAGVAKATVYRRWASREDLVADALEALLLPDPPDTGQEGAGLREDLIETLVRTTACQASGGRRFVTVLAATTPAHPRMAATLRARYIAAQRAGVAACLRRAQDRGELTANRVERLLGPGRMEIAAAIALMMGYDSLFGAHLDSRAVARVVDEVLLPLLTGSP